MSKKILVMLSQEIKYKDWIIRDLAAWEKEIDYLEAPSYNLVECTDYYVDHFKKGNYQNGLIIWITGVAVSNLLQKSILDKNALTVETNSYLQKVIDLTDILVLGEMLIGYKNLVYMYKAFVEEKLEV